MTSGVGRIIIRCHNCGAKLYKYAIGDKDDKNKFNGPPVPKRALGGFDDYTCPVCGTKLLERPRSIRFLPADQFPKLFVEDEYRLRLASEVSSVVVRPGVVNAVNLREGVVEA